MFKDKKILNKFDEESFNLSKKSTQEERYRSAYKLEEAEHYEAAMKYYRKLTLPVAKEAIIRCQAGLLCKTGDYEKAADLYLEIGHMREVIHCYKMVRNKEQYLKYLLLYDSKNFTREFLLNKDVSYEKEIKPYLKEQDIKEKLEQLCKELYHKKLEHDVEEKQLLIWEIEEMSEKVKKAIHQLKEEGYGRETT